MLLLFLASGTVTVKLQAVIDHLIPRSVDNLFLKHLQQVFIAFRDGAARYANDMMMIMLIGSRIELKARLAFRSMQLVYDA